MPAHLKLAVALDGAGWHPAAWREPTASLHWAGTEAADQWNGYMEGAISAGYRAADELADTLAGRGAAPVAQ